MGVLLVSRRRGGVAVAGNGGNWFAGGGLLAPDDKKEELLAEFTEQAVLHRSVLTFFNVGPDDLALFRRFGFQATKWGEEALIDLTTCDWSGRAYEWVRRQSNFCRRQGLVFSECPDGGTAADDLAELSEISGLFLANKPQMGEISFLESRFDPRRLGRKRIFIARSHWGSGRIEGFLACNPAQNGAMWSMETYRQRPDAVRGTIPFLLHQAMQALKSDGVQTASLCLIPGLRCDQPLPGDSPLVRWGIVFGTQRCNLIFDAAGAYHFKSAFRPRYESRYLCVMPRMTLGSAWAFIRLLGVLKLDFRKMARGYVRRLTSAARDRACEFPHRFRSMPGQELEVRS